MSVTLFVGAAGAGLQTETKQESKQQKPPAPTSTQKKDDGKTPSEKESEKAREKLEKSKAGQTLSPAELIAETVVLVYGGRDALKNVRGSIKEEGTIKLASDQGEVTGQFMLRSIRKETSWTDLLRTDLELTLPEAVRSTSSRSENTIKHVFAFNGASVWSAKDGQYVNLRPEAEAAFRALLTHDYTTLLRYREDGSKVELVGPETVVGIETKVIDLTTSTGEKSRFWISAKSYRILHLEYELKLSPDQPSAKYRISYYPPMKVVQNTLVPARRVMKQDGKFVQEINLTDITYSAKLDTEIFQYLQSSN